MTIPSSVTSIDGYAFNSCSGLTSVTIPNSVTSIGAYAFYRCTGLTSITIPSVDCLYNKEFSSVFSGYNNLHVTLNGGTSIGEWAFSGCSGLTSVTIPDSVTSIGSGAFASCKGLTSVTIPNSVTSIGSGAFASCSGLTELSVDKGNTVYHSSGNCIIETETKTLVVGCKTSVIPKDGGVTRIGNSAFLGCSGLASVTIPDSVTSIGNSAFYRCTGLTSVTIPDSVTSIETSAFYNCTGITSITIPDSVTSIGSSAFSDCTGLASVTIPDSVTSIGSSAFSDCTGLASVTIPNSVTSIGEGAFANCSGLTELSVDRENAFYHSSGNCIIETKTKTLVAGCKTSVIPTDGSVTSIGKDAFYGCSGLTNITIPDSVTSIGEKAFFYCGGLTSITIPDSVTSIGSSAFSDCSGLTSITIPDSVTSIGNWAFSSCKGLTSITIPSSVTSIGSGAFQNCSELTNVIILSRDISIENSSVPSATTVYGYTGSTAEAYATTSSCRFVSLDSIYENQKVNISVESDFGVNFRGYNLNNDFLKSKIRMEVTFGNRTVTIDPISSGDDFMFSFMNVAPQELGDEIVYRLTADGHTINERRTTIRDYLETLLTMSASELGYTEEKYQALKALVYSTLEYGAAAQNYTGHNTDSLVNSNCSGNVPAFEEVTDTDKALSGSPSESARFKSLGVRFGNVNRVYFKFTANDVSKVSIAMNGKTYTAADFAKADSNTYILYTDGISPTGFNTVFTTTMTYDGIEYQTASYSIKSLVYSFQNKRDASGNLTVDAALARATHVFGIAAKNFASK